MNTEQYMGSAYTNMITNTTGNTGNTSTTDKNIIYNDIVYAYNIPDKNCESDEDINKKIIIELNKKNKQLHKKLNQVKNMIEELKQTLIDAEIIPDKIKEDLKELGEYYD